MPDTAYRPYVLARRPGGKPSKKPKYRVLVHRLYVETWRKLPERVGTANARQFYDHVANSPGTIPSVGKATILAGKAGRPAEDGFSRTIHYGSLEPDGSTTSLTTLTVEGLGVIRTL